MPHIINAVIKSASLSKKEGFLTVWLDLELEGGCGQGFGGTCLHNPTKKAAIDYIAKYIYTLLEVAGVDDFSKLSGKAIRVSYDTNRWGESIKSIGHITKDIWLDPAKLMEEYNV